MRFKIDWASLIVKSKFTVFALFYFVFEGKYKPPGGLYLEGRFNAGVFALPDWKLEGLVQFYGMRTFAWDRGFK